MDDGNFYTSVMDAVDPDTQIAHVPEDRRHTSPGMAVAEPVAEPRDLLPIIAHDGKRTIAMNAVDLAALGLDPSASGLA